MSSHISRLCSIRGSWAPSVKCLATIFGALLLTTTQRPSIPLTRPWLNGTMLTTSTPQAGLDIVFPITPRHALILLERQMFSQYLKMDGRWVEMEANDVDHCNELQVVNSHRQIFSSTGDFQFVEDMYRSRPDLFAPRDDRI